METIINHEYLLSETAIRIWQTNDKDGENKMFICITKTYKEKWIKGKTYNKSSIIQPFELEQIAEDAFLNAWKDFNERGKAGKIKFIEPEYAGYIHQAFHRTFMKMVKKAIKEKEIIKEYERRNIKTIENDEDQKAIIQQKIEETFKKQTLENVEIIKLRYIHKLKYPVIAKMLNILEDSCRQKLYRAKQDFRKKWNSNK